MTAFWLNGCKATPSCDGWPTRWQANPRDLDHDLCLQRVSDSIENYQDWKYDHRIWVHAPARSVSFFGQWFGLISLGEFLIWSLFFGGLANIFAYLRSIPSRFFQWYEHQLINGQILGLLPVMVSLMVRASIDYRSNREVVQLWRWLKEQIWERYLLWEILATLMSYLIAANRIHPCLMIDRSESDTFSIVFNKIPTVIHLLILLINMVMFSMVLFFAMHYTFNA